MPNIKIREQEAVSLAAFDITENTVLVPMLYARTYDPSTDPTTGNTENIYSEQSVEPKLFTSAAEFRTWASGHTVNVDNSLDKSYIMAYELLLQGLNVVVQPLLYDNASIGNSIDEDKAYEIVETKIVNEGALDEFKNRNLFNIKFITTGGYSNCGKVYYVANESGDEDSEGTTLSENKVTTYTVIRELAKTRGDAIALIEFKDYFDNEETMLDSIQEDYTPEAEGDLYGCNAQCHDI